VDDDDLQMSAAQADEIKRCYEANASWVYGYAHVLVGRDHRTHDARAAAEDLLQDTFVAAAHAWTILRNLTEVQQRAWLRTTVTRMAGRMGKRNQMFRDLAPDFYDPQAEVQAGPEEKVMAAVASGITFEKVSEAIDGLPFQQRMIAIMKWIDHMKTREIAAELGTSPNTVSVQLHSIRQKLKYALGSQYPFAPEVGKDGTYDND
jgi:RNA polymerase sigma factor (sigma-70 family)